MNRFYYLTALFLGFFISVNAFSQMDSYLNVESGYNKNNSEDLNLENYNCSLTFGLAESSGFYYNNNLNLSQSVSKSEFYPENYYSFNNNLSIGDEKFFNYCKIFYSFDDLKFYSENTDYLFISAYNFFTADVFTVSTGIFYTNMLHFSFMTNPYIPLPYIGCNLSFKNFVLNLGLPSFVIFRTSSGSVSLKFTYFPDDDFDIVLSFLSSSSFRMNFEYKLIYDKINTEKYLNTDDKLFNRYQEAGIRMKITFGTLVSFDIYGGYRYWNSFYVSEKSSEITNQVEIDENYLIECALGLHF